MKIVIKLGEVLKKRGMTQKELAKLTGIRESGISALVRSSQTSFNKEQIAKIATVLEITDIKELIDFEIAN
ncbi:transcriptional regulator [Bacillus cereus]|uniref:Transcriptional regulator n=2 Tax=Bacillus cereus group TaxID=86661 RepID=A0A9X6WGM7_BACTU|nr:MULTISPECIES: helix-turn-helix transcriptional regulator [Bacillus cereus group]PDZ93834.1 transcriptional regulator [Bacillus cereus]PFJ24625.1 transcriptional regulator [Bacillus thuringiensis]PGP14438.1 transcriptional regulator [Bacillus cereus]